MNKIAVLGGTGKAGSYIIKELVKQGFPVKMLVRTPGKVPFDHPLVEVVTGNAKNYATIQRFLSGSDAVISALGPSQGEENINSVAVGHVIKVMGILKIRRYIEIAGLGIATPDDKKGLRTRLISGVIKTFFKKRAGDRQKAYEMLATANLDWTIIRCPSIEMTDTRRHLKVSLADSPGTRVSSADLAGFIVNQINDQQYLTKCPFVAS